MLSAVDAAWIIRPATEDDAGSIGAIYNHYVAGSTCTYQEEQESVQERLDWLSSRSPRQPVIVALHQGEVVGWGAIVSFHTRSAFRFTGETSVYVHPSAHRRGIGRALLEHLVSRARELGYLTLVAAIDSEQEVSIRLHEAFGFREAGRLKNVGFKFGRWLDVVDLTLDLTQSPPK